MTTRRFHYPLATVMSVSVLKMRAAEDGLRHAAERVRQQDQDIRATTAFRDEQLTRLSLSSQSAAHVGIELYPARLALCRELDAKIEGMERQQRQYMNEAAAAQKKWLATQRKVDVLEQDYTQQHERHVGEIDRSAIIEADNDWLMRNNEGRGESHDR